MKRLRGGEKQWKIRELHRSKKGKERQNKIGKMQKMLKKTKIRRSLKRKKKKCRSSGRQIECSTSTKVEYSPIVEREARHWWNMIKIARGDDVSSVMTWEDFEDLEMENYCPQELMDKLEEEFLKLQQNDMTVPKYTVKFNEKARFAKYQVATEERKIKQYIWGLRARIMGPVQQARPSTFQEAVELALMVEKENNCQLEEGGIPTKERERIMMTT
ncbi:zinc finger, CCHC-type, retrotransposon gag domain protein [Tanacetum coccineum]